MILSVHHQTITQRQIQRQRQRQRQKQRQRQSIENPIHVAYLRKSGGCKDIKYDILSASPEHPTKSNTKTKTKTKIKTTTKTKYKKKLYMWNSF